VGAVGDRHIRIAPRRPTGQSLGVITGRRSNAMNLEQLLAGTERRFCRHAGPEAAPPPLPIPAAVEILTDSLARRRDVFDERSSKVSKSEPGQDRSVRGPRRRRSRISDLPEKRAAVGR
jgi:hypothetical protein